MKSKTLSFYKVLLERGFTGFFLEWMIKINIKWRKVEYMNRNKEIGSNKKEV